MYTKPTFVNNNMTIVGRKAVKLLTKEKAKN